MGVSEQKVSVVRTDKGPTVFFGKRAIDEAVSRYEEAVSRDKAANPPPIYDPKKYVHVPGSRFAPGEFEAIIGEVRTAPAPIIASIVITRSLLVYQVIIEGILALLSAALISVILVRFSIRREEGISML